MLVADNPMYAPGEQYWMGVGVEYNQSRSIWVNDIAFTLDDRPVSSINFPPPNFTHCIRLGEDPRDKKPMSEAVRAKFFKTRKEHEKYNEWD